jgi:hypothetical protein
MSEIASGAGATAAGLSDMGEGSLWVGLGIGGIGVSGGQRTRLDAIWENGLGMQSACIHGWER